jgi:hypothetical protein
MIKNGGQPLANALKHFLKTLTSGKNGAMTKEDVIHGLKTLAKQERKAQSLLTRPREAPQEFERWYIAEVLESAVLIIEQRDSLAEALRELCGTLLADKPRDITDLLNKAGDALAAVKGGCDE